MAALPEDLTTRTNVKAALGIPTGNTTDDDYIDRLIHAATAAIQEFTGRKLVRRMYNGASGTHAQTGVAGEDYVFFSGKGKSRHCLPQYPISTAGFVLQELASRENGEETWDTLEEDEDYVLDRDIGILDILAGVFERGTRNYRVTMAAGYQTQDAAPWVPYDLEQACIVMVREAYKESERLNSEKIGDISRSYDMTKHRALVEDTIANYRADSNFM